MTTVEICEVVRRPRSRGMMARALVLSNQVPLGQSNCRGGNEEDFEKIPSPIKSSSSFNEVFIDVKSSCEQEPSPKISTDEILVQGRTETSSSFNHSRDSLKLLIANKSIPSSDKTSSPTSTYSDSPKRHWLSRQSSVEGSLKTIQENEQEDEGISLSSTQHLKSGFFRTIKKQYPAVAFDGLGLGDNSTDSGRGESPASIDGSTSFYDDSSCHAEPQTEGELPYMSNMARKRLQDLRKVDPKKVDVATGLQWIRLELHEMREQDKALFLQLIKLHSTIKEIRTEMNVIENDSDDCCDDISDAASLWWPRCNSASVLPDFSASDGAHLLKRQNRPYLRRGASLNQPKPARFSGLPSSLSRLGSGSFRSFSSSVSSQSAAGL